MASALIMSGTRVLCGGLAAESLARSFETTVVGNRANDLGREPALKGAMFRQTDIADPHALPRVMCGCWERMTHAFVVSSPFPPKRLIEHSVEDLRFMIDTDVTGPIAAMAAFHRLRLQRKPAAQQPGTPYHLTVIVDSTSWQSAATAAVQAAAQASLAHFTRNFASEVLADLPEAKVTLVHLRAPRPDSAEKPVDVEAASARIWDVVLSQEPRYMEYHLSPNHDGPLRLDIGALQPEYPPYQR
jgi:NAD(P)-dependent dehydrogenase (short-subunit alcohol dehydrogenase family)